MVRRIIFFGLILLLVGLFRAGPGWAQTASTQAGPDWHSFGEVVEQAETQGKHILVDIYAPWCPWCRKMQKEVYTEATVRRYLDKYFEASRLDATDTSKQYNYQGRTLNAQQLASHLGMQGTPTTVFLQPDGTYIAHIPGFIEADRFQHILHYIGSGAHKEQGFQEYLEAQRQP